MVIKVLNRITKFNRKYRVHQECVTFKIGEIPHDETDPEEFLKGEFKNLVNHITDEVDPDDKVGFIFTSDKFHKDAYLRFRRAGDTKFEDIWELLGKIYQSNTEGFSSETFRIHMTALTPYRGKGRVRVYDTFEEECRKRGGIVTINNKDNLCLARALVVAIAYVTNVPYLNQIRRNIGKKQDEETQKLINDSGIDIPPEGAGIEELHKFQDYLKDYKITVYEYGPRPKIFYRGLDAPLKLNLLYHKDHFNVITSLTSAFSCDYFCDNCLVRYSNPDAHLCDVNCPCCHHSVPCDKTSSEIECNSCNRDFRGISCFDNHLKKGNRKKSVCETVARCSECLYKYKREGRAHVCYEFFCFKCKDHQPSGHRCFIPQDRRSPDLDKSIFIFYDLETRLVGEDEYTKIHKPILCVFQQYCDICINEEKITHCKNCGYKETVIDTDVIATFMKHILSLKRKFKTVTVVAHNSKGFDCQFIAKYILEETDLTPELIMQGRKIMRLKIDVISFIDSLNYFPMKLSGLPGAFGLRELKKGYFPHLFNTEENALYNGLLPAASFYEPDSMSIKEREKFILWHEENKNKVFDIRRELVEYCTSDVDILAKSCLKFHKMFLDTCNVSPFTECFTLASACMLVYRRNFLKPYTIGIIPSRGYRETCNQSRIASKWLIWNEQIYDVEIQHSLRGPEAVIHNMRVDGLERNSKTVFEFYGCFFHGHTCIKTNRNRPIHKRSIETLEDRYERTLKRAERLRELEYKVEEMWECTFRKLIREDSELDSCLENHPLMVRTPLVARDAFYGGRTGNTKTHYKVKEGEEIRFIDITSLYPYICVTGKIPVGHPTVLIGEDCKNININNIEGLIKCKILPPDNLYHPVLPIHMNNKLLFVLCNRCSQEMSMHDCVHTDEERAFIGTWVVDEVRLALEKEYVILEVFEVWSYSVAQMDKTRDSPGLFSEMMYKFIKIKTEASGWGHEHDTKERRQAYIKDFHDKEGVQLEEENMVENPGLRSLAKLTLNSFWGKWGQREHLPKTSVVRQYSQLAEISCDPTVDINFIEEINDDVLLVNWSVKEDIENLEEPMSPINVVIASYVTSQARIKLYSYLDSLGTAVLYYDTDSVIYVSGEDTWQPLLGRFLGDMVDQLEEHGPGSYITEFTSGGPKNYSYRGITPSTQKTFEVCKVKGINLNYEKSKLINYGTMTDIVTNEPSSTIEVPSREIRVTKQRDVATTSTPKTYRAHSVKRRFDASYGSTPYGTKQHKSASTAEESDVGLGDSFF